MPEMNIYTKTIREIIVENEGLSWKYAIITMTLNEDEEEDVLIEYWEKNTETDSWEKKSDFRIDLFCAQQVFEAGLNILLK